MRHRLLALSLSLVLLLAQQLGMLHLLSHGPQPAGPAPVLAQAESSHGNQADAGDALCQVCLVLAMLGAASLPMLWGWLARLVRGAAPLPRAHAARAWPAPAPYHARGPPPCLP